MFFMKKVEELKKIPIKTIHKHQVKTVHIPKIGTVVTTGSLAFIQSYAGPPTEVLTYDPVPEF